MEAWIQILRVTNCRLGYCAVVVRGRLVTRREEIHVNFFFLTIDYAIDYI